MARGRPLTKSGMLNRFGGSAISTATGFAIGSVVAPTLRPLVQDLTNLTWSKHRTRPLSPEAAAEATIRGLLTIAEGDAEAAKTGISEEGFDVLRGLAGQPPGDQQLLELWNRDAIDEGDVDLGLKQSRMRPEWYDAFKTLRHVLPSVAELVRWGVREVFDPQRRKTLQLDAEFPPGLRARLSEVGFSDADIENAWAAHWELPSATQGAQMAHRGAISDELLDELLKALDYSPTWREPLKEILRPIPGLSDMIRFAVREAYDEAKVASLGLDAGFPEVFAEQAALHGLSRDDAVRYWRAHWRLPSARQGYQMLWRGEINEAQLDELLTALDYPEKWRKRLANIAHVVPGRIDLRRMFAAGIIDRAGLIKGYERIGYAHPDAVTMADLAAALQTTGAAESHVSKAETQLWTTTHRSYISAESDDDTAADALRAAGVAAAEIPKVLALWQAERALIRKQLTPAQVKKAYKNGVQNEDTGAVWTQDDAIAELLARGYTHADAVTFLTE